MCEQKASAWLREQFPWESPSPTPCLSISVFLIFNYDNDGGEGFNKTKLFWWTTVMKRLDCWRLAPFQRPIRLSGSPRRDGLLSKVFFSSHKQLPGSSLACRKRQSERGRSSQWKRAWNPWLFPKTVSSLCLQCQSQTDHQFEERMCF